MGLFINDLQVNINNFIIKEYVRGKTKFTSNKR